MSFRPVSFAHLAKFNSAASSEFIEFYNDSVQALMAEKNSKPSHKTFAPSSFRCLRHQWFRLRGSEPDKAKSYDSVLQFKADLGTACHTIIQNTLKMYLKDNWIDVKQFLAEHPIPYPYKIGEDSDNVKRQDSLETFVEILDPPVRFACDGIILWKDRYYLLEIKTSEYASFNELTNPKPIHVDQMKCYATLLGLDNVLALYQDRQYGDLKCYELKVSESEKDKILKDMRYVQSCVESNIPPDCLPTRNRECSLNSCAYYKKCLEWG